MNTAVIEFNALTDADGPRAQHQHHGLTAAGETSGLAVRIGRGIKIRSPGVEFPGAGVHHGVRPGNFRHFLRPGKGADGVVGITHFPGLGIERRGQASGKAAFEFRHVQQPAQEPFVDFGNLMNFFHADAAFQRLEHGENAPVVLLRQPDFQRFVGQRPGI